MTTWLTRMFWPPLRNGKKGLGILAALFLLTPVFAIAQSSPWPTSSTWPGPVWDLIPGQNEASPVLASGDFNGDVITDLFYQPPGGSSVGVGMAVGTSFAGSLVPVPSSNCYQGNFDGSGRTSLACGISGGISLVTSTGAGLLNTTTTKTLGVTPNLRAEVPRIGSANPCLVMDVNGDGRDDLVCGSPSVMFTPYTLATAPNWGVYISSGAGFTYSNWANAAGGYGIGVLCLVGDFNGDGLKDLACSWGAAGGLDTTWEMLFSTGVGWAPQVWINGPSAKSSTSFGLQCFANSGTTICANPCIVGDFDGDGIDDIACNPQTTSWSIGFGGGKGGFKQVNTWTGYNLQLSDTAPEASCRTADLYGVGRAGIICTTGATQSATNWVYEASTGTGFSVTTFSTPWSLYNQGQPLNISQACVFGDFNGDGIKDITCGPAQNGSWLMGLSARPQ